MATKMELFKAACVNYLNTLGISDLRSYGREVGVARPTAKNKEDLIAATVGILAGELLPIPVSKQGAPVKYDRVDERIPLKIENIKREYFKSGVVADYPDYDFNAEYQAMRERTPFFGVASSSPDGGELCNLPQKGQVHCVNGEYYLLNMDGSFPEKPLIIPLETAQRKKLKEGDVVCGYVRRPKDTPDRMEIISAINGHWLDGGEYVRVPFDETPVCVLDERIQVYDTISYTDTSLKFIEWLFPLGKGGRGCVYSAPKAGKTRLLLELVQSSQRLNDDLEVFVLLVDESPETIGEFRRIIKSPDRLIATTYEDDVERQVFLAEFLLNRVKRMAESKKHVLLVIDSLNALARAFNDTDASSGGKTLPCGLEVKTLRFIKKYFGSARCLENGGSLTVLGAVCADTGNPMDDVLSAEISAQASYEIRLNNELAVRRLYPAVDVILSRSNQGDALKNEREKEFERYLRNVAVPKIGSEGVIKALSQSITYEDFIKKVKAAYRG